MTEARKTTKLSQRKFAAKIGQPYSYVRTRESQFYHTTIEDICTWANGCDIDPVVFFSQLIHEQEQIGPNGAASVATKGE